MKNIGISDDLLAWLQNYSYGRKQFVEINNKRSSMKNIWYGVPQGSLFGTRLFSIYVNDLSTSVSSAEVHMYADDTTAFVVVDSVDEVVQKLREASSQMNNWCECKEEQSNVDNNQKNQWPTLTSTNRGGGGNT